MPHATNRPREPHAMPSPPATPAKRWPASRRRLPCGAGHPPSTPRHAGAGRGGARGGGGERHAALAEDRPAALLVTGRAAELIGELEAAVADAPLRERRWGQLMLALYPAGRQGDAIGAYQRAGRTIADE